jgi:hypothetical protein
MVTRAIALLAAVCTIAPAGLFAAEATAATVTPTSYGGRSATALFEHADGCMQQRAFVFADEGLQREGHDGRTESPAAIVSFALTNVCTGTQESFVYGNADLAPGDLSVRGDLGAASLRGTVLVDQPFQGAPDVRVTFDLEWHSTGDALRRTWKGISRSDDIDIGRELWAFRPAVVSGSFSHGLVDYTAATPSLSAAVSSSKVGDIAVSR